eukprot:6207983-Pleurochrysis_carterae.AAC.2
MQIAELDIEEGKEDRDETQLTKKGKKPARRSIRAKEGAAKSKAAEEKKELIDVEAAPAVAKPAAKRAYSKTGMYSKDPKTAALARAKLGKASGKASQPPRTPLGATARTRACTPVELAEIAKLKQSNQDLKVEIKLKEADIRSLQIQLDVAHHAQALAVSNKELDSKLELSSLTEAAYNKGFAMAMKNFQDVKHLLGNN